jgi:hypothetical protein
MYGLLLRETSDVTVEVLDADTPVALSALDGGCALEDPTLACSSADLHARIQLPAQRRGFYPLVVAQAGRPMTPVRFAVTIRPVGP